MKTTCLVVCFNEFPRIKYVINTLLKVDNIDEIVVVDDSSNNQTVKFLQKIPDIKIIHNSIRQGKTEAIRQGLRLAEFGNILLFDGDLTYFDTRAIEKGIHYFATHKALHTLIFRADYVKIKFTGADLIQSGVRLIRKDILNKVLAKKISGYQETVEICYYTQEHNLQSAWTRFPSKQHNKVVKYRSFRGLIADFKMNLEIFRLRGFWSYIKLVQSYRPKEIKF